MGVLPHFFPKHRGGADNVRQKSRSQHPRCSLCAFFDERAERFALLFILHVMPLYNFSIEDGDQVHPVERYWFPNDQAARRHARRISGDFGKSPHADDIWLITVKDENERHVALVPIRWMSL